MEYNRKLSIAHIANYLELFGHYLGNSNYKVVKRLLWEALGIKMDESVEQLCLIDDFGRLAEELVTRFPQLRNTEIQQNISSEMKNRDTLRALHDRLCHKMVEHFPEYYSAVKKFEREDAPLPYCIVKLRCEHYFTDEFGRMFQAKTVGLWNRQLFIGNRQAYSQLVFYSHRNYKLLINEVPFMTMDKIKYCVEN